jgi:hypothetical protein
MAQYVHSLITDATYATYTFSEANIGLMVQEDFTNLTHYISRWTPTQIRLITAEQIPFLTSQQINVVIRANPLSFNLTQFGVLSTDQIDGITDECLRSLATIPELTAYANAALASRHPTSSTTTTTTSSTTTTPSITFAPVPTSIITDTTLLNTITGLDTDANASTNLGLPSSGPLGTMTYTDPKTGVVLPPYFAVIPDTTISSLSTTTNIDQQKALSQSITELVAQEHLRFKALAEARVAFEEVQVLTNIADGGLSLVQKANAVEHLLQDVEIEKARTNYDTSKLKHRYHTFGNETVLENALSGKNGYIAPTEFLPDL